MYFILILIDDAELEKVSSVTMLTLTMMNDSDIASKLKAVIHILFLFGRVMILIILIRQISQDPLFGTGLVGVVL